MARYKGLADIEQGFRVLKSEIEIAPMFRRLPERFVRIDDAAPIAGISTIHAEQADTLAALKIKKPTPHPQQPLLQWRVLNAA